MTGDEEERILKAVTAIYDPDDALSVIKELVRYLPEVPWEAAVDHIADDYDGQMGGWAREVISNARERMAQ